MKSRQRKVRRPLVSSLMITPMIDMFTVILIFLIVSYAPEQAKILKSEEIEIPQTELKLERLPALQIEVTAHYIAVNGERIQSEEGQTLGAADWSRLMAQVKRFKETSAESASLVIADKATPYRYIDRAVSTLSASGFSEVYFLTQED